MKKFLLMLTLLLPLAGVTCFADKGDKITSYDGLSSDKYYVFVNARPHGIKAETNYKPVYTSGYNLDDKSQYFTFEVADADAHTYYIKAMCGNYLNHGTATSNTGNPALGTDKSDAFKLTLHGNSSYPNNPWFITLVSSSSEVTQTYNLMTNGSQTLVLDPWSAIDDGDAYAIIEVGTLEEIESQVSMTINYQINGQTYTTKTAKFVGNSTITAANIPAVDFVTVESIDETTATDGGTINATCSENLPFLVSEDLTDEESMYCYAIDIHNNEANYLLKGSADGLTVGAVSSAAAPDGYDKSLWWAFTGNLIDGFKLYNPSTEKYVVYGDISTLGDEGTDFHIAVPTGSNKENGFCFYKDAGTYFNHQGTQVMTWSATDEGSTMHVQCAVLPAVSYINTLVSAGNDENAPEGALGMPEDWNPDYTATFSTYIEAINQSPNYTDLSDFVDGVVEMSNSPATTIEAGKYYRLYNRKHHQYMSATRIDANTVTMQNLDGKDKAAASVVKFVESGTEGQYYMQVEGLNIAKYVQDNAAIGLVADGATNIGSFEVAHNAYYFTFKDKVSDANHSYLHINGYNLVGWTNSTEPSQWYVVPATDVEVELNTVGENDYATLYLPFPVSTSTDATAYTGTLNDAKSVLNLTAVEGTIPANTGVVLKADASTGTATFAIAEEEGTAVENNALTGSNVSLTANLSSYLVLGKGNTSGEIGFYAPSSALTTIDANKAYLLASDVQSNDPVSLSFNGAATGITTAELDGQSNAPLYDLSGRRVMKAVKGGVYVKNGQKFIVK